MKQQLLLWRRPLQLRQELRRESAEPAHHQIPPQLRVLQFPLLLEL